MVSKRSLRPDPNFDLLISKIYPSRDEYEAHQERVLAKLNKSHSQAALVNSITEGIKLQSQNRPQRSRKNANESENTSNVPSYNNTPNVSAPATPNPAANVANQSDSSQGPTALNNSGANNSGSQNSNSVSQPASSPAISGNLFIDFNYRISSNTDISIIINLQVRHLGTLRHHLQIQPIKFQSPRNVRRVYKIRKMIHRAPRPRLEAVIPWWTLRARARVSHQPWMKLN